jgi:N-acetylneuraminic acid mutarotase
LGGSIYIVGGSDNGAASKAIYRFDPTTHAVSKLGTLPVALQQAAVASIAKQIIVLGGQGSASGSQTDAIYSIKPDSGRVTRVGTLPLQLAGAVAVSLSGEILLAGGAETSGQASSEIYAITAA